jgi:16S rRNA (cytosine967-C5)-methyltransferase
LVTSRDTRQRPPADPRPGFAAREVAAGLLAAVLDEHHSLDALLESHPALSALPPRDRALARAVVGTALRRHGTLDAILNGLVAKRPPRAGALFPIMEIAAAQVLFMDVADHAAVSVAIDQIAADHDARHFKGLANAVLRRIGREKEALLRSAAEVPGRDTPEWLWSRWLKAYGDAATEKIADAHRLEPSLDFSVKRDPEGWAEKLGGIVLPTGSVRAVASGPIELMPGFAEGEWWVQDAAAALPAMLLGDVRGMRIADLCAAPGGKTAALANAGAEVTAVDISGPRLARLADNLKRLGLAAKTVTADVLSWQPQEARTAEGGTGTQGTFDAILLDAPCTSTGTIRRHPDIAWLKRSDDVAALAALQAKMIARATSSLKPGGILVYCTCSLEPEEGEAQIARAVAELPLVSMPVSAAEIGGLTEAINPYGNVRTLPFHLPHPTHRLSGLDGFFIARLRKAA